VSGEEVLPSTLSVMRDADSIAGSWRQDVAQVAYVVGLEESTAAAVLASNCYDANRAIQACVAAAQGEQELHIPITGLQAPEDHKLQRVMSSIGKQATVGYELHMDANSMWYPRHSHIDFRAARCVRR
jgi:hypothetical protein